MRPTSYPLWPIGLALSLTYFAAAQLGLQLAFVSEQVTTVWAPTGIAQAALLVWGRRLWPAVWVGAFAANASYDTPLWADAAIATGNTLEAVALAWLLPRPKFDPGLSRLSDAARLIVYGAMVTPIISATVGVTALCLGGSESWARFGAIWPAWWLGDALGSLVVAPVILTWLRADRQRTARHTVKIALGIAASAIVTAVVFGDVLGPVFGRGPLHYVLFPLVIVSAVALGQPATALVVFTASAVTVVNTAFGAGPFGGDDVNEGLALLQIFMGVLASTALLLAAAMSERRIIQRRVVAAQAVGEVLADAPDLERAAPQLLRGICRSLEWQAGAIWLVDAEAAALRCFTVWIEPIAGGDRFARATREITFTHGRGLPGRVWQSGQAAWIEDVTRDPNFPRQPAAKSANLHGAFGFPIRVGGEVLGVIEFFTGRVAAPDGGLLAAMSTIGNQVGQFISRKRVEESIRRSEERFRSIATTSDTLTMYEQDRELRYVWLFPQRPEFVDHNIGKRDDELVAGVDGQRLTELKRAVLESGVGRRDEITVALPGGVRAYDLLIEPRRDRGGAVVGVGGIALDITERKRQEQLLRDSQEQLREADRRKDEFLAILAHELRNPLAPIRAGIENLRFAAGDPAALATVRDIMERQVSHMVRLVDDLLDVSRISRGKIQLHPQPAVLSELVQAAIDANRIALDACGAALVVELPPERVTLVVDPTRFTQVLSNLLHNATKFTGADGSIRITAGVHETADGRELHLTVADTGAGIDRALLPRVFELFTQGPGGAGQGPAGLGVGLALADRIVRLHGGSIEAHSGGAGAGSEFRIRLPLAAAVEAAPAGVHREAAGSPIARRVLVVDDNADAAEMTAWLVRSLGSAARVALDGPSALRESLAFRPDIVLLDIGMHGMDGYDTCRALRAQSHHRQPFIVAVTGWGQERDKAMAAEAGFDLHVIKPADPAVLERILRTAMPRDAGVQSDR